MRTAREMHAKMTFRKLTKCYSGRRETISCLHHSNKCLLQKNGINFLAEADGVQYRRNVTHVKKNVGREDRKPKAESSDAIGSRDLAADPESQVLKVPADTSNRPSEKVDPPECKQADLTVAQSCFIPFLRPSRVRKVLSKYQDYVLGNIRLNPE